MYIYIYIYIYIFLSLTHTLSLPPDTTLPATSVSVKQMFLH